MKSLIDSFGRRHNYLRISVTDRCNLRCQYCVPANGIKLKDRKDILRYEEIFQLVKIFAGMGIQKVRFTGGEPLVMKNLPELISRIKQIQGIKIIGLTTNGMLLQNLLPALKDSGLTHLNISLDTLKTERFHQITRRYGLDDVLSGIDAALKLEFPSLKINSVIMGGINDEEILDFIEFIRHKPVHLRFIEYMPFKSNQWKQARFIAYSEMKTRIEQKYDLKLYHGNGQSVCGEKIYQIPGFAGKIGFITPISDHFCHACNRLRLTADGFLKSCLFNTPELNLKELIRQKVSEDEIKNAIQETLYRKPDKHPSTEELVKLENRFMNEIGG